MPWHPTHRITFAPTNGASLKHWLIMWCRDPYSSDSLVGVTEDDFRKQRPPTWRYRKSDDTWWWQGVPTPLWNRGDVLMEPLEGAPSEPLELAYGERRFGSDRFVIAS
jgi:hypothetical protein